MRKIKFRAWDRSNKCFYYFRLLPDGGMSMADSNGDGAWGSFGEYERKYIDGWEQFTGLQDKNGNDIYEGDVVRVETRYTSGDIEHDVKSISFFEGSFCYDDLPNQCSGAWDGRIIYYGPDNEVVGNIHGTPELLC